MKKTNIIFVTLLFITFQNLTSFGQHIFSSKTHSCMDTKFILEGEKTFMECDLFSLSKKMLEKTDRTIIQKTLGDIKLQVLVDTIGKSCLQSFDSNLNKIGKKIDFSAIFENSTFFSVPIRNGQKTYVSTIIKITFTKTSINFFRIGYNTKIGFIENNVYIYNRM
jgi:hypothetical protein